MLWNKLPFSNRFLKFRVLEPSKITLDFWNVLYAEMHMTQFGRVPLWNFGISEELHFFRRNEIISWGKNRTALFQTHNWEQSNLNLNWFLWPTPSHFDSIHIISVIQICPSRVWECCETGDRVLISRIITFDGTDHTRERKIYFP